jgi:hypothetical protein
VWTMNNWQWDHVAQQNPATIYPVGWLEAYKHKRLRSEWRYFVGRVKARQWRSVRNTFNGYLAEHDGHPHNAGRGWTKRAAERRVNRLCDEAMFTTLAEWWPGGGAPPPPPEPAACSAGA